LFHTHRALGIFPFEASPAIAGYWDVPVPVDPPAVFTHIELKYKYLSGDVKCGSWVFNP
jgi:hypothetical protein